MTRHMQRTALFKLLFIKGFYSDPEVFETQVDLFYEFAGSESDDGGDKISFAPDDEDIDYINEKFRDIVLHIDEIDAFINEISESWKTQRMSRVDLNIIRLALYEMIYDADIPTGVAINEAVEIAKKYGGEESGSFVNGLLGKAARIKGL